MKGLDLARRISSQYDVCCEGEEVSVPVGSYWSHLMVNVVGENNKCRKRANFVQRNHKCVFGCRELSGKVLN